MLRCVSVNEMRCDANVKSMRNSGGDVECFYELGILLQLLSSLYVVLSAR